MAYRDAKSVPNMTKSSSWYDGLMGCLKPVMSSMMGKQKSSNSQSDAAGNCRNFTVITKEIEIIHRLFLVLAMY